jgi:hypothetical protein
MTTHQGEKLKRRKHARHGLALTVGVHTGAGRSFATLYDISRTGAFVAIEPPPGAGSKLTLSIRMTSGRELRLPALVRHSMGEDSPKLLSGIGIEFEELSPETAQELDELLDRISRNEDPRGA